ncbi:MAG: lipid II flippase MurJ [Candidatus Brocadiia bacterium]
MSEGGGAKPQESIGHRIVRAMFVVIFFQFFWKFGGLIITLLVGSVFKATPESDAYFFVTETVVFLLQTLCLKIFIPVVVPIFKEQVAEQGEEAAWRFGSTVLTLAAAVLGLVTASGMVFAPQITGLIAEGFNERQSSLTTHLMRFMFPGVFAICLATVTYALLNSYNIFGYAAAGDAVQKLLWAGVFLAASMTGLSLRGKLDALAVAFLLAAAATLLTHLVGLRSKLRLVRFGLPCLSGSRVAKELGILVAHAAVLGSGLWGCRLLAPRLPSEGAVLALQQAVLVVVVAGYLLLLWWRAKGRTTPMAKFAALSVPLLFGILFAKYRDVLTNLFASFTGTGVFSDLKYARKVGEGPNTLVIAALSIAILPHLCELATGRKWDLFGTVMTRTVRTIVLFFVPLAALTVVLRRPIIQLLFDRGDWTDYHLYHAGDALGLYILALPFFAIENPIQQSFFAMQRMWTPTLIGFLGSGFHILFLFVGIEWLGFGYFYVVALVYMAARAFKNVILLAAMRYHVKILPWRESVVFLAKALAVTVGLVLAAHATYRPLKKTLSLRPYRRRQVMLDTFNIDLRSWESENLEEFRVAGSEDPGLQVSFPQLLSPEPGPPHGHNVLLALYRRSPRRAAGLRRDFGEFDLRRVRAVAFDAACSEPAVLRPELVTRERQSFYHEPVTLEAGERRRVEVDLAGFRAGGALPRVVGLWIRDVSEASTVARTQTALAIDNLTLVGASGEELVVDDFEPQATGWRGADGGQAAPRVADTGERPEEPELALRFPQARTARRAGRPLGLYRLAGTGVLTFKARSDAACTLRFAIAAGEGEPGEGDGLPRWEASADIERSDRRQSYRLPLPAFQGDGPLDLAQARELTVEVPPGVELWLDNVAFVHEPAGLRLGGISVTYEVLKLLHVALPALVALTVFVLLLIVFRVEEIKSIWQWLRERALSKVLGKLGR